jgi:hypothetical protein
MSLRCNAIYYRKPIFKGEDVRIKNALFIILMLGCLLFTTCELFPPECALEFYLTNDSTPDVDEVTVWYEMENIGSENLQNCKMYFDITDGVAGTHYRWTPGVDLDTGEFHSDSYTFDFPGLNIVSVELVGAGWDNPPDD